MRLRQSVFVVEQNCAYVDSDGKDAHAIHLLGYLDNCYGKDNGSKANENKLIATLRFFEPSNPVFEKPMLGRICTAKEVRGKGVGKAMMEQFVSYAEKNTANVDIYMSAQAHLERFYNQFGFNKNSDIYLEDNIPHIEMCLSAS
jgi:ElaA protein